MTAFLRKKSGWDRQDEEDDAARSIDRSMKMLEEIRDRILNLQGRIGVLERVINERVPSRTLTEKKFMDEVKSGDDIVDKIVSEVKIVGDSLDKKIAESLSKDMNDKISIAESSKPEIEEITDHLNRLRQTFDTMEQKPTIVEMKRLERITKTLQKHEQLSSTQLSQLIGLSRTRCNEYFKLMEAFGIVEPMLVGKEKFYKLS